MLPDAPLGDPYQAPTAYSENTVNDGMGPGGESTITRTATGAYRVRYHGLGVLGGTVQVTANYPHAVHCKVGRWVVVGDDQVAYIRCLNPSGNPVNALFVTSFTNDTQQDDGAFAYLWANQPTAGSYTPISTYQHNSSGGTNTIQRTGTGSYTATLPGVGGPGGNVQVTAYGYGAERCKVLSWGWPAGSLERVYVRCFDSTGTPDDTRFTLTFARENNLIGSPVCCSPSGRHNEYAWADEPTAGSYTLSPSYSWTSRSFPTGAEGTRIGTGHYAIRFRNNATGDLLPLGDGVSAVTAYGAGPEFCNASWWSWSTGIRVRCFDASGAPADTRFSVTHIGNWTP